MFLLKLLSSTNWTCRVCLCVFMLVYISYLTIRASHPYVFGIRISVFQIKLKFGDIKVSWADWWLLNKSDPSPWNSWMLAYMVKSLQIWWSQGFKLNMGRLASVTQVGPNCNHMYPYRGEAEWDSTNHRGEWDVKSDQRQMRRCWLCSDVVKSLEVLAAARSWKNQGPSPLERPPQEGVVLSRPWFWTCDLQNSERVNLGCFKTATLWSFVATATGN